MDTRVINLIPQNYEGDPHKALGYGRDRNGFAEDVYGNWDQVEVIAAGRPIVYVDGYLNKYLDDVEVKTEAKPEIIINCMWCGGGNQYIYPAGTEFVPVVLRNSYDEDEDTYIEPAHGAHGYCRKCHSYCFGDCTASA